MATPAPAATHAPDPTVRAHERSLYASLWVPFAFTIVALVLRFWARILRRSLGRDDWTMLFGWVLYTIGVCLSTALVAHGSLKHVYSLTPHQLTWIAKVSDITQEFGSWAACISKAAVGLLLPRLLNGSSSKWRNYFIYINIAIYAAITTVTSFTIFFQCDPPRALWHPELIAEGKASCPLTNVNTDLSILQSSYGIWMDFMLAALPATFIYNLKIPLSQKVAICFLLGMGVFAGAAAIVKTIQFTNGFASSDPTYNTYALFLWAGLELPFVIIAGSLAPAKPIFDKLFSGKPIREGPSVGAVYASNDSSESRRRRWFSLASSRNSSNHGGSINSEKVKEPEVSKYSRTNSIVSSDVESQRFETDRDRILVEREVSVEHDRAF